MNRRQFTSQLCALGLASNRLLSASGSLAVARTAEGAGRNSPALAGGVEEIKTGKKPSVFPAANRASGSGDMYMHNYYVPAPTSTPLYPVWSPSGEEIAFSLHGSIWKMKLSDNVAYELTANPTYDSSPTWSPDGNWIVYTAEHDSQYVNLNILEVATGKTSPLTTGEELNLDPVWSPDGSKIAFVSTQSTGWFNIYAMPITNGEPEAVVRLTEQNDFGHDRLYFGHFDLHIEPTWSPDSRELILVSNRGITLGTGAIWRMPAEPNGMANAKMLHREETLYRTRPDWSPDGDRIVYSSHLGGQFNNLFVLPAKGGEPYKMTFGDWCHFHPRWSPDGSKILYVSNQSGLTDFRILEAYGGKETKIEIRKKVYKRPMAKLNVRVIDTGTGKSTDARIYLEASDGKTYAPDDTGHRIGRAIEHFFYAGNFEVDVPAGPVKIEAVRGFEYWPASKELNLAPGQVMPLTVSLSRMTDFAAKRWYGDSDHVHMSYGGTFHATPPVLMRLAGAEDLSIVCDLVANKDNRIFDYQYFRGALDPLSTKSRLLYFNEEYRPPFLGHMSMLNLKTHLISPFTTGYENTAIESIYPTNTDILRLARAEGAIGGYVHPFDNEPSTHGYARARGLPMDVAFGTVDYLEVSSAADDFATSWVWHRLLNCGFKVAAAGGEDSEDDLYRTAAIGSNRAYVYLGTKFDWDASIQALRKGASFVTNGPLLEFSIDGRIPGSEIKLPASGGNIQLRGSMKCIVPVEKVEVMNNGVPIKSMTLTDSGKSAVMDERIPVTRSGWYTLRAYTTRALHPIDAYYVFAETSPIYVYCGDSPIRSAEDAAYFVKWIEEVSKTAAADPGWRSPQERKHVLDQFEEARQIYLQRGKEAS